MFYTKNYLSNTAVDDAVPFMSVSAIECSRKQVLRSQLIYSPFFLKLQCLKCIMIPVNLGLRLDSSYPLSGTSLYNLSYHYVLSVLHKNCQKLEQTFLNLNSNTFEGSLKAYSANINSGFQMRIKSLKFHRDRY